MVGQRAQGEEGFLVSRIVGENVTRGTVAAASRLECGGPFCALHLQANSSIFVHFPCFLLSARIVCARRNTVNDRGLPLCLE